MNLEQCKRLKEMGFPRNEGEWFYDSDGEFLPNPTAEEALAWVAGKLDNDIYSINFNPTKKGIEISAWCDSLPIFTEDYPTLSDAVYALIVWCYENKLLEGK